ncbi:hypothetical protein OG402_25345 [Streptomyces anulatus]|uniref:hypothetical protein n=1 Tax=Streptomyces anulatus TaxID=1892 RepID=UPI00225C3A3E|nr:hypothetical protein [Streptomyces anulatus]MCX4520927.1 hypothetical protein [Streptomyces anulatus]MCX4603797.1 hypothetical protein [Streptomyces anulatus]
MHQTVRLELLGLADTDDDELLHLGGQLRRSLQELDVLDVRSGRSTGHTSEGAKSSELIAAGSVVVTAASLALRQVLLLADTWWQNRPVRGIRVEMGDRVIELSDATTDERARLIDKFLSHCEVPAEGHPEERSTDQS